MLITQKSRYGLRAVFELSKRLGQGPIKISDIARAQAIPPRFLEGILRELKQAGMVESRRGSEGGYFLLRSPERLTLDDVLVILQGPIDPMGCVPGDGSSTSGCDLYGRCVFLPIWEATRDAVRHVFQQATFASLVQRDQERIADGAQDMSENI